MISCELYRLTLPSRHQCVGLLYAGKLLPDRVRTRFYLRMCFTCFKQNYVFIEREFTFTFAMCYRPSAFLSVCRLSSVTVVHPTQAVEIFGSLVRWPSVDIHRKFHGDRSRETPPTGEIKTQEG